VNDEQTAYFERWIKSFEALMDERDRRYAERFEAMEKLTAAAFTSNERAIGKAEEAQRVYNTSHNDLTRKMESQAREFVNREKLEDVVKAFSDRLDVAERDRTASRRWTVGQMVVVALGLSGLVVTLVLALLRR